MGYGGQAGRNREGPGRKSRREVRVFDPHGHVHLDRREARANLAIKAGERISIDVPDAAAGCAAGTLGRTQVRGAGAAAVADAVGALGTPVATTDTCTTPVSIAVLTCTKLAAIIDTTNAHVDAKTPSEKVAKEMLSDVLLTQNHTGRGIIVTTFSSHIARLKSIIELGHKMGRKVVILGRSMYKYITAAEELQIVKFSDRAEIVKFSAKVKEKLRRIDREGKEKYLIICTGHQGEPKSVLSKIASGTLEFNLGPQDTVVFSCRVIPTPTNRANRERLESQLKRSNVRMYRDVHQSGHASGQDVKRLVEILKPRHIIPSHGEKRMKEALKHIALGLGYDSKHVHMAHDGQRIVLA